MRSLTAITFGILVSTFSVGAAIGHLLVGHVAEGHDLRGGFGIYTWKCEIVAVDNNAQPFIPLYPGDRIWAIDDRQVLTDNQVHQQAAGIPGTMVDVIIWRDNLPMAVRVRRVALDSLTPNFQLHYDDPPSPKETECQEQSK